MTETIRCCGGCVYASDVLDGAPYGLVAYPFPGCPLHDPDDTPPEWTWTDEEQAALDAFVAEPSVEHHPPRRRWRTILGLAVVLAAGTACAGGERPTLAPIEVVPSIRWECVDGTSITATADDPVTRAELDECQGFTP